MALRKTIKHYIFMKYLDHLMDNHRVSIHRAFAIYLTTSFLFLSGILLHPSHGYSDQPIQETLYATIFIFSFFHLVVLFSNNLTGYKIASYITTIIIQVSWLLLFIFDPIYQHGCSLRNYQNFLSSEKPDSNFNTFSDCAPYLYSSPFFHKYTLIIINFSMIIASQLLRTSIDRLRCLMLHPPTPKYSKKMSFKEFSHTVGEGLAFTFESDLAKGWI